MGESNRGNEGQSLSSLLTHFQPYWGGQKSGISREEIEFLAAAEFNALAPCGLSCEEIELLAAAEFNACAPSFHAQSHGRTCVPNGAY